MRGDGGDFADLTRMDPAHNLDERRSTANLESNVHAHFAVAPLRNRERAHRLRYIDAHRLFAVSMLAGTHHSIEMLDVKPRRG